MVWVPENFKKWFAGDGVSKPVACLLKYTVPMRLKKAKKPFLYDSPSKVVSALVFLVSYEWCILKKIS